MSQFLAGSVCERDDCHLTPRTAFIHVFCRESTRTEQREVVGGGGVNQSAQLAQHGEQKKCNVARNAGNMNRDEGRQTEEWLEKPARKAVICLRANEKKRRGFFRKH